MRGRVATPPDQDGRWVVPYGVPAILEELELCGVPLDASREDARRLLELNGVYVAETSLTLLRALRTRAGTQDQDPSGDLLLAG